MSQDKTYVSIPKRQKVQDFYQAPAFDKDRYLSTDEFSVRPKQSIAALEKGYDVPEYAPVVRNLSENIEGTLDISSPFDDIYEAAGGTDPYFIAALDWVGPAEIAGLTKAGLLAGKKIVKEAAEPELRKYVPKGNPKLDEAFENYNNRPIDNSGDDLTLRSYEWSEPWKRQQLQKLDNMQERLNDNIKELEYRRAQELEDRVPIQPYDATVEYSPAWWSDMVRKAREGDSRLMRLMQDNLASDNPDIMPYRPNPYKRR